MFTNSVPERDRCSSGSADAHTVTAKRKGGSTHQNWDIWQMTPCSAKGSQQDLPVKETCLKLRLLLCLGPAKYVIHNTIHRLLVLFLLR